MDTGQADVVAELLTLNNVPVAGRPGVPVAGIDIPAAVVSMAVVMADCDPPVEVWMNTQVFRSLRDNVLNLRLSIAVPLWDFVLQDLSDVDRSRLNLRSVGQVDRWKLDRTVISISGSISNMVLQIGRKRDFEVRLPVMVFAIALSIPSATIVQHIARDCGARAKLQLWLSEAVAG